MGLTEEQYWEAITMTEDEKLMVVGPFGHAHWVNRND